ncbi:MAG: GDP-mannose 4,6-dehydratase [Actinomycetes bacterium]
MTTALITGASGQDGTILSRMLIREGVSVVGLVKPGTDTSHLIRYAPQIKIVECDLGDSAGLTQIAIDAAPDLIYNLGGFTAPGDSWDHQDEVRRINVGAVEALLNAMRKLPKQARMFQASSALVFEGVDRSPQTEAMETGPKSPYAKSKADAMALVREARENDGLFAVSGVFYNHESPLRGPNFVTRKISMAVAKIAAGQQKVLELGDIEVARDWGWAPDYVAAAKLMLEADEPSDYLLATGISHRLSYFITKAFQAAGIADWSDLVVSTSDNARQADTNLLVGESKKAYTNLGWRHTVDFDSMAQRMVEYDMALLKDPELLWLDF